MNVAVGRSLVLGGPPHHYGPSLVSELDANHVVIRLGGNVGQGCESRVGAVNVSTTNGGRGRRHEQWTGNVPHPRGGHRIRQGVVRQSEYADLVCEILRHVEPIAADQQTVRKSSTAVWNNLLVPHGGGRTVAAAARAVQITRNVPNRTINFVTDQKSVLVLGNTIRQSRPWIQGQSSLAGPPPIRRNSTTTTTMPNPRP